MRPVAAVVAVATRDISENQCDRAIGVIDGTPGQVIDQKHSGWVRGHQDRPIPPDTPTLSEVPCRGDALLRMIADLW